MEPLPAKPAGLPAVVEAPYAELAAYLARVPDIDRRRSHEDLLGRMLGARSLAAGIKRFAHLLKLATTPALLAGLAVLVAAFAAPSSVAGDWFLPAFHLVNVTLLAKLFLPLVDLETRAIQFGAIALLTALFALSGTPQPLVPVATGATFAILCVASKLSRRAAKLRAFAWMMRDPDRVPAAADELEHDTIARLDAAGVGLFGDARYVRTFEAKGKGTRRTVTLIDTVDAKAPPPKGRVRVEVWRRDPRRDLSAIREFFVCCFLGGSQDASAFDFLLSRTVTMLDFVSPKGRTLRVLLLAAEEKDMGPVLVVDAVFGRDGGLVGSVAEDDAFVRDQIRAYARFAGFEHVLLATTSTNRRPRLFLESARGARDVAGDAAVALSLFSRAPIKVEVFNRRAGRNLYAMLLGEIFNLTDAYASRGRVRGTWLHGGDLPLDETPLVDAPPRAAAMEARTRSTTIALDAGLASENVKRMLDGFLERIPGMDGAGVPAHITVRTGASGESWRVDPWKGPLVISPNGSPDPFAREIDVVFAVAGGVLQRAHPDSLPAIFASLEALSPPIEAKLLASASAFRAVDAMGKPLRGWLPWQLCVRALRRKYDATKVFKAKELHAWIVARPAEAQEQRTPWDLCRAFLAEKAETYEGFRDKFLAGIPGETREAVLDAMAYALVEVAAKLPFRWNVPDAIEPGDEDEVVEELAALEKEAKRHAIEIPLALAGAIETARARAKRLQQITEIEGMLANKHEKAALAAIGDLRSRATDLTTEDLTRLSRLAKNARAAPFDRLIERLNVDGLF